MVKKRTIANLSACSSEEVEAIRLALEHKNNLDHLVNVSKDIALEEGLAMLASRRRIKISTFNWRSWLKRAVRRFSTTKLYLRLCMLGNGDLERTTEEYQIAIYVENKKYDEVIVFVTAGHMKLSVLQ